MRVKKTSYGQRILNSFAGFLIGIVLFFGSFVVIFVNEGRENFATYARNATEFASDKNYETNELTYIIGSLNAATFAEDHFLKTGNYIYLERRVEMYAYIETEHQKTEEHLGGSSTTTYTYSYELSWVTNPKNTSTFKGDSTEVPSNIPNQYNEWISNMPQDHTSRASGLTISGENVSANSLSLTNAKQLNVTADLTQNLLANESVTDGLIFRKNSETGSNTNPGAGDVRITYFGILDTDRGILLGSYENNTFTPFYTNKNNVIYRFFAGVETQSQAVNILQTEYQTMLWIFRLVAFLMMFFGLLLFASPMMTLASVVPIFAKIGRFVYGIVAFIISLVLTTLTIILGIIFNNIYLSVAFILLIIVVVVLVLKKKKKAQEQLQMK